MRIGATNSFDSALARIILRLRVPPIVLVLVVVSIFLRRDQSEDDHDHDHDHDHDETRTRIPCEGRRELSPFLRPAHLLHARLSQGIVNRRITQQGRHGHGGEAGQQHR
jgi:hypothetical protein